MGPDRATAALPEGQWEPLSGHGFASETDGRSVTMPAWGAYFARLA
jgi:alpha-glucosidase